MSAPAASSPEANSTGADPRPAVQFLLPGGGLVDGKLLPNESVAHAAVRLGIDLRMSCGGHETCSSCQMTRDGRAVKSCQERSGGVYEVQLIALHDTAVQIISDSETEAAGAHDPVLVGVEVQPPPAQFRQRYRRHARVNSIPEAPERSAGEPGPGGAVAEPAADDDYSRLRAGLAAAGWPTVEIPFGLAGEVARLMAPRTGVTLAERLHAALIRHGDRTCLIGLATAAADLPLYAAAIDLGTTTVVAELVDCRSGAVLVTASAGNAQVRLAEDVAARISVGRDRLAELHALVIKRTLQPLIEKLATNAQISTARIGAVVVAGNTVMTHLMLNWPTDGLGHVPFNAVSLTPPPVEALTVGIKIHPQGQLIAVPSLSGYVGGDLMSGLIVTGLPEKTKTTALIDVGTNAEILLAHNGHIYATSTPAGPSFEGGGIRWGVRARAGAIEHIRVTADGLTIETIGQQAAVGVCGSGLVDLLAEGLRSGLLSSAGRFQGEHPNLEWIPPREGKTPLGADAVPAERSATPNQKNTAPRRRLVLARADQARQGYGAIYITEAEIAQLLQAKAAIFSGFYTLLEAVGVGLQDIDELLLAGGFARHIDLRSAIGCGLLPDIPKIRVVGNTSLAGALRVALDCRLRRRMEGFTQTAEVIELNLEPTFEQNFIDALFLPNVRRKLFPSVVVPAHKRRAAPPAGTAAAVAASPSSAVPRGDTAP